MGSALLWSCKNISLLHIAPSCMDLFNFLYWSCYFSLILYIKTKTIFLNNLVTYALLCLTAFMLTWRIYSVTISSAPKQTLKINKIIIGIEYMLDLGWLLYIYKKKYQSIWWITYTFLDQKISEHNKNVFLDDE